MGSLQPPGARGGVTDRAPDGADLRASLRPESGWLSLAWPGGRTSCPPRRSRPAGCLAFSLQGPGRVCACASQHPRGLGPGPGLPAGFFFFFKGLFVYVKGRVRQRLMAFHSLFGFTPQGAATAGSGSGWMKPGAASGSPTRVQGQALGPSAACPGHWAQGCWRGSLVTPGFTRRAGRTQPLGFLWAVAPADRTAEGAATPPGLAPHSRLPWDSELHLAGSFPSPLPSGEQPPPSFQASLAQPGWHPPCSQRLPWAGGCMGPGAQAVWTLPEQLPALFPVSPVGALAVGGWEAVCAVGEVGGAGPPAAGRAVTGAGRERAGQVQ